MPEYAHYRLTLTTLTPLHIGCGVTLLHEYDYAIWGGRTWRIDDAAFLDAQQVDDPAFVERLAVTPPARLLGPSDFTAESPFFRYVIRGRPRSQAEGAQVQEQLKDAYDRPYLPGSSLKGALRTALGWMLWDELGLKPEMRRLNRSSKRAAQAYERQIFGETPNTDLLRALQITDSQPISAGQLMLVNARVLSRSGSLGSPIELEAVRPETELHLELKLDLALFSDWAKRHRLRLNGETVLGSLPAVVNARTLQRARQEAEWFQRVPNAKRALGFYQQLARIRPEPNQFVLQLGWGSGWDDKTFGDRLKRDQQFMAQAVVEYRLSRGSRRGPVRTDAVFPSSRRVAMSYRKDAYDNVEETPALPLGWVLVTFEPADGKSAGWEKAKAAAAVSASRAAAAPPKAQAAPPPPVRTSPPAPLEQPAAREPAEPQPQVQPARKPAPAIRPRIVLFTGDPEPGERFLGTVYYVEGDQVYLTLPGLSDEAWLGVAESPGRRLKEGKRIDCEVISVQRDPDNPEGWLVRCEIVRGK